jgi:iron complex outermembrane recepter protein
MKYVSLKACSLLCLASVCNTSFGQTQELGVEENVGADVRGNRLIEEVVVTARKREESSQDIPIAIAAFSGEKLDAFGVESAQDLGKITPGLVYSSSIGFSTVFLRGIGSDAFLPSADPSVPIYIDDINSLPAQGATDSLVNVERVEVLKGPQGTLFGRNALGGAVRIVTPDPSPELFSTQLKFETSRFEETGSDSHNVSFFSNIPLTPDLAATVSGVYRDGEPLYKNDLGRSVEHEVLKGGRAKIKWYATDSLDITLSGMYEEGSTSAGLTAEGAEPAPILCAICAADPEYDYYFQGNQKTGVSTRRYVASAIVGWELPFATLKSIASDQRVTVMYASGDLDYTSTPMLDSYVPDEFGEQQTFEIRMESNEDTPLSDKLKWVVGMYYLESLGGYNPAQISLLENSLILPQLNGLVGLLDSIVPGVQDILYGAGVTLASYGLLDTRSFSVFSEATYTAFDRLDLTLGLRHDRETRDVVGSRVDVSIAGLAPFTLSNFEVDEATTERLSPRFSAMWNFDEWQVYASYSIGYLSPTYNTVNFFEAPDFVEQEEDRAYEVGFKGRWLEGVVQLEGALFYTERYDIITAFTSLTSGGAINFFNAGDGEVKGAELSLQLLPMPTLNPGLALVTSASYLDGKYTDYPDGRGFDETTGLTFGPDGLTSLPARDFSGNDIVQTPELTASATILQTIYLGADSELELAVDSYYNSGYYFTAQNISAMEQESYQTFDARITYFYNPWGLQLTLFGENITDERYFSSAVHIDFGPGRTLAAPAQYGARVKWTFE